MLLSMLEVLLACIFVYLAQQPDSMWKYFGTFIVYTLYTTLHLSGQLYTVGWSVWN